MSNNFVRLPSDYQNFIVVSRYARWLDDQNRREFWNETVDRYIDNIVKPKLDDKKDIEDIRNAILNLEVMPSMRAMMSAGPAADRDNTCMFNCSYIPIDDYRSFDEVMAILLAGTGVGFSVERQNVNKLHEVPDVIYDSQTTIVVKDSKEGWAKGLRQLVTLLYAGEIPKWDLSQIRPAGSRLKTFGGRAGGPDCIDRLFRFVVSVFKNAVGRKLTSLECHDIVCKIAEVVVVGGIRRSALISLSNLSDDRMRNAKSGQFWETNPHRAISNNSVSYTEKPDMATFMEEWLSLVKSGTGERGIFSRIAAQKHVAKNGRRDNKHEFGTNPCCFTGETLVETVAGIKPIRSLVGMGELWVYSAHVSEERKWIRDVKLARASHTGSLKVFKVSLSNGGSFNSTDDHLLATRDGKYVQVKDSKGVYLEEREKDEFLCVEEIEEIGIREVFDLQVEDNHNFYIMTNEGDNRKGLLVHNSEIILRPYQFCNLSEVVIRSYDTIESIKSKVRIATIIGTIQSCYSKFPYLRKIWAKNTEEERLLGVSLTGIMDNAITNFSSSHNLPDILDDLRKHAIEVNKEYADKFGIEQSTAITCVKPSGTVSQVVDAASGIHARHSKYYIRSVRADNKDPLTLFMKDHGIPHEPDLMSPENITVFYFPIKSPEGSLTRHDRDAIWQLELWKIYATHWCEHKPSVTISVKEHEWMDVGAWIYKNFDIASGLSFLPMSDYIYKQPPYDECDESKYNDMLSKMPESIDWSTLSQWETIDTTKSSQTFACSGTSCEVVDLT